MKRVALGILLAVGAYLGLKDLVRQRLALNTPPADAAPPNYGSAAAWIAYPDIPPAGAWERPWGVDVFVVAAAPATPMGDGLVPFDDPRSRRAFQGAISSMDDALSKAGPVYAPAYRHPSAAAPPERRAELLSTAEDDIRSAFQTYLESRNLGRGVLLVAGSSEAADIAEVLIDAINGEPYLVERFAGLAVVQDPAALMESGSEAPCSPAFKSCTQIIPATDQPDYRRWLSPNLPYAPNRVDIDLEIAAADLSTRSRKLSAWLDANAAKPAEPLPPLELVEVAPINRPTEPDLP